MKQTNETNSKQATPLCSLIVNSDNWPALKSVLYNGILNPHGFEEVRRAIQTIEEMGQGSEPEQPSIVNDKESATAEPNISGIDPDLQT